MQANPGSLLGLVISYLSGTWVFLTHFPSLLMWHKTLDKITSMSPLAIIIGWVVWVIGFVTETKADAQKPRFRAMPENVQFCISPSPVHLPNIL